MGPDEDIVGGRGEGDGEPFLRLWSRAGQHSDPNHSRPEGRKEEGGERREEGGGRREEGGGWREEGGGRRALLVKIN